jgi:hypothetical protein
MDMEAAEWGLLRQIITDQRRAGDGKDLARCLMCGSPVFIRANFFRGRRLPGFVHFDGADDRCPWFTGVSIRPDDARAAQYNGQQESPAHRLLCELIAKLALLDGRTESAVVSSYLAPTQNDFGRYPDVLVTRSDGWRIAIELQLSNTFQTEISGRSIHYDREGIPLLWILFGIDFSGEEISQSFRDVILRHRENAFVLDNETVAESLARKTLILRCHLRTDVGTFDDGRLISLDDLIFPSNGLPYVADRLTPRFLEDGENARRPWRDAMRSRSRDRAWSDLTNASFLHANERLCALVPGLRDWQRLNHGAQQRIANLICVVFSVMSYAAGEFRNYASRQPNIQSLLNSKLPSSDLRPFAEIMSEILSNSAASELLSGSVGAHLQRALDEGRDEQIGRDEPAWTAMRTLMPEILDPLRRLELEALDGLPKWAVPVVT